MPTATAREDTPHGIRGVRFETDVRPDPHFCPECGTQNFERVDGEWSCNGCSARWPADLERELYHVQQKLGGEVLPSSHPTGPHLSLRLVSIDGAPDFSVISLWVPMDKRAQAEALLNAAGFDVSNAA